MIRYQFGLPITALALIFVNGMAEISEAQDCSYAICDEVMSCDDIGCDSLSCEKGFSITDLIRPSDHCFDDFISPMSNLVFFEDPRTLTEFRPIYINHSVPSVIGNGVTAGGDIQLYAAQFRIALTEKLSIIAVKDGFIIDDTSGALDTLLADGWADVAAGLKYNVIRAPAKGG